MLLAGRRFLIRGKCGNYYFDGKSIEKDSIRSLSKRILVQSSIKSDFSVENLRSESISSQVLRSKALSSQILRSKAQNGQKSSSERFFLFKNRPSKALLSQKLC